MITRWWFQRFYIFTPKIWEMIQFDEHIFQMGWFNHQLDILPLPPKPVKYQSQVVSLCFIRSLKLSVSLPLKIDSDWALQKEINHLPTIDFQTLVGFLRGVVITLIFPNVPQSSLGILRVPHVASYLLPLNTPPLRTLQDM